MDLLPKVFRTEGDMVEFDPSKILNSIIDETGMDEEKAKHVTELVVRRIISSGIRFLSGPHIREIVCSILSENRFEQERKLYTRIGMPLMDYEEVLEFGLKKGTNSIYNPEKIHHWAANQLAEEYTLLRILNDEESEAHLYGDIYIHQLKYFDLRPYSQVWDPRLILKKGIPLVMNQHSHYNSNPPKNLQDAIFQLTNWFGIIQNEFCGSQIYDYLNVFLAPFAQGIDYNNIKYAIETALYQLNYISMILSKGYLKSCINNSPVIPDTFRDFPAIGPNGQEVGIYKDYEENAYNLLKAFIEVFAKLQYNGLNHKEPLHAIYFQKDWVINKANIFEILYETVNDKNNPILVNHSTDILNSKLKSIKSQDFFNHGIMQKISINLPRIAFLANDEDSFLELMLEKFFLCFNILKKKQQIIQKRIETNHLPLCNTKIEGRKMYDINKQECCVGFVGLNEAVKILTNSELHESNNSILLGERIISHMTDICEKGSKKDGVLYSLIEDLSNTATRRFVKLDLKHFPSIPIKRDKEDLNQLLYCNSAHFNIKSSLSPKLLLQKQSIFHKLIKNGAHENLKLIDEEGKSLKKEEFLEILQFASSETQINRIKVSL